MTQNNTKDPPAHDAGHPPKRVQWDERAKGDMKAIRSFYRPPIEAAVAELVHQAEIETRHRKRLRAEDLPPEYPDPTWQISVREYRVLYVVDGETVRVLRVRLKGGSQTTREIL